MHAYLIADGYRLTATGTAADVPDEGAHLHGVFGRRTYQMSSPVCGREMSCAAAEIPENKKKSSVKGWNQMEDGYAFRYEDPTGECCHHSKLCRLPVLPGLLLASCTEDAAISSLHIPLQVSGTQSW